MPKTSRALTRAARDRAESNKVPYTQAREELLWMRQLLDEGDCATVEEADAYVTDPANQTMCQVCGWTYGMVCPECLPGCGCSVRCTGWRHAEFNGDLDDYPEDRQEDCPECGGSYDSLTGYGCAC